MTAIDDTHTTKIVYDAELRRPGCALLQASYGIGSGVHNRFPVESWLVYPSDNLGLYEVTDAQLAILVARAEAGDYET